MARLRQALEQTKQQLVDAQNQFQTQNERGAKRRRTKRQKSGSNQLPLGTYYALIIGNNQYQHLSQLKTAVNDAKAVDELLRTLRLDNNFIEKYLHVDKKCIHFNIVD